MPPNIYIIGAQSTGKTTLVSALQKRFESTSSINGDWFATAPTILTEVARGVLREHSFSAIDIESSPTTALQIQRLILRAQNDAEIEAEGKWFISDRSAVDTAIYAERFGGPGALAILMDESAWNASLERMRLGVIVVCEAGVPWLVDDGTRLMPKTLSEWLHIHDLFSRRLRALGLDFVVLPRELTALESRVDFVVEQVKEVHRLG